MQAASVQPIKTSRPSPESTFDCHRQKVLVDELRQPKLEVAGVWDPIQRLVAFLVERATKPAAGTDDEVSAAGVAPRCALPPMMPMDKGNVTRYIEIDKLAV